MALVGYTGDVFQDSSNGDPRCAADFPLLNESWPLSLHDTQHTSHGCACRPAAAQRWSTLTGAPSAWRPMWCWLTMSAGARRLPRHHWCLNLHPGLCARQQVLAGMQCCSCGQNSPTQAGWFGGVVHRSSCCCRCNRREEVQRLLQLGFHYKQIRKFMQQEQHTDGPKSKYRCALCSGLDGALTTLSAPAKQHTSVPGQQQHSTARQCWTPLGAAACSSPTMLHGLRPQHPGPVAASPPHYSTLVCCRAASPVSRRGAVPVRGRGGAAAGQAAAPGAGQEGPARHHIRAGRPAGTTTSQCPAVFARPQQLSSLCL